MASWFWCREGILDADKGATRMRACAEGDLYPSDFEFVRFDDQYGSLSERGHPHFRPGICPPTRDLLADERTAGSPALHAYAWYADLHTGAIKLARANDPRWLGTALLLEFYGLHFLEDSVAPGHMQAEPSGATNVFLSSVHDAANRNGVLVERPPETLCRPLDGDSSNHSYLANQLPHLKRLCSQARAAVTGGATENLGRTRLLGDHVVQFAGVKDEQVATTFEWASFVVYLSLNSLWQQVQAATTTTATAWLPPAGWRSDTRFASHLDDRPTMGFPTRGSTEGELERDHYRRMLAWWSTPTSVDKQQRQRDIREGAHDYDPHRQDTGPLAALQALPMPVPLAFQAGLCTPEERASINRQFVARDFGGALTELSIGPKFDTHQVGATVSGGVGIALPPSMFPAQGLLLLSASGTETRSAFQLRAAYRQLFGVDFPLFLELRGGPGVRIDTVSGDSKAVASLELGTGLIFRARRVQWGAGYYYGYDPALGLGSTIQLIVSQAR